MLSNLVNHKRNIQYTFIVIILLLGICFRFFGIDNPVADWHSFRQADTASVARLYIKNGINLFDPRYHDISTIQSGLFNPNGYRLVEFPVYNALIAYSYKLFPLIGLETWARILSVYFTIISALAIYLIGKRFINTWGGILAAFFFLFIPYNIYFTRVILPEPLTTAMGLLGLLFFVYSVDIDNKKLLLLSSVLFSLAILVKPFTVFYFIPLTYLLINKYKPKSISSLLFVIRKYLVFSLIVLIPFFIWRYIEELHPEGIPFYKWIFNGDGIRFKPSFWRWIFGERLGYLILGTWGLILFATGLIKKTNNFFIHYFLLGMFLYVSVVATANVRHDYYQTLTIPAIALTVASGALFLIKRGYIGIILLLFSFFVMMMVGLTKIREFYKIDHPEIIDAGVATDMLLPKNAIIIAPYNGDTAFLYQTKRTGWPYVDRPISEMIKEGAQYYVSVNYDDQTNEFISKFPTVKRTSEYIILKLQ
jgi:4-amino-4-deoxy-L-arabinose transferase-like glycosyltransferase